MQELYRSNHQYIRDIHSLRKRHKHDQSALEAKNRELVLANKELAFALKQQKAEFESERQELLRKGTERSSGEPRRVLQELRGFDGNYETVRHKTEYQHILKQRDQALAELEAARAEANELKLELRLLEQQRNEAQRGYQAKIQFLLRNLAHEESMRGESTASSKYSSIDFSRSFNLNV